MRIALIGTRGVPAQYGGFETAVEEVGRRLVERGHDVTVFCRNGDRAQRSYLGMRLVHLPAVQRKVLETLSHTGLSVLHRESRSADVAVVFNAANAPLLPVLRAARVPVAVHVDGLEWQRSKWGPTGRRYYQACERLSVRWADALIADAHGIQDHYRTVHRVDSTFIPYGAPVLERPALHRLGELDLAPGEYHVVVARFEPENHVLEAVDAHVRSAARLPLVVVGAAPYAHGYTARVRAAAAGDDRVRLIGPVWDQELLDALYAGSLTYVHGHSVGGTNPSLLRAMGGGAAVLAYDVVFNREVLGDTGCFWPDADALAGLLLEAEADPAAAHARGQRGQQRAAAQYTWDGVAEQYEQLCVQLLGRRGGAPSAPRTSPVDDVRGRDG